jgi:hypothetical protein
MSDRRIGIAAGKAAAHTRNALMKCRAYGWSVSYTKLHLNIMEGYGLTTTTAKKILDIAIAQEWEHKGDDLIPKPYDTEEAQNYEITKGAIRDNIAQTDGRNEAEDRRRSKTKPRKVRKR